MYLGGDSFAAAHIEDAAGAYFNNLNVWFSLSWTPGNYIGQGPGYAELVKAAVAVYMSINTRRWLFRAPSKAARDAAPPRPTDANGDSLAAFPIDANSLDDVEEVSAFAACLDKKYEGGVDLVLEMRGCFPHPDDAHLLGFEAVDQPPNHIIKSTLMHVVRARDVWWWVAGGRLLYHGCRHLAPPSSRAAFFSHPSPPFTLLQNPYPTSAGALPLALEHGVEPGAGEHGAVPRAPRVRARGPHPRERTGVKK